MVDKPTGVTSFSLVGAVRRTLNLRKVGHCGTLDPLATGLMVLLVGRNYTRLSDQLLGQDKSYEAEVKLGEETDSYDAEGTILASSDLQPKLEDIQDVLQGFQGIQLQTPPMYSAKKQNGRKLYELARKGQVVEREPVQVRLAIELLGYQYPYLSLNIHCTKGTYIRSLAQDIGQELGCGAHLSGLRRTQSGQFCLRDALPADLLKPESAEQVRTALAAHTAKWRASGASA